MPGLQSFEKQMRLHWYPVFLCLGVILLGLAAWLRGPWIDEYWMLWLTEPSLTFKDIFSIRWMGDMHPPAYEMAFYAIQQAGVLSIPAARMFNFIALALGAGLGGLLARHYRQERFFLMLFSASIISTWFFFNAFGDFRSYAFGNVAFCLLLCSLKIILARPQQGQVLWPVWTVYLIALLMSLNIHYISIIITVLTVATFAFVLLYQRRFAEFFAFAISGALFILPTGIFAIAQAGYLSHALPNFWLKSSALVGLYVYYVVLFGTLQTSLVTVFILLRKLLGIAKDQASPAPANAFFAKILFTAVMINAASLYAINFHTPLLVPRYLVPLSFSLIAALIAWVQPVLEEKGRFYSWFILNAFLCLTIVGSMTAREGRWIESAHMVQEHLKACPTSRVITSRLSTYEEKQIGIIMTRGYESLARDMNIPLFANMQQTDWLPGATCPDIVWFAHLELALLDAKNTDELVALFYQRYPGHAGCPVTVDYDKALSAAVFLVSNDPKSCAARK